MDPGPRKPETVPLERFVAAFLPDGAAIEQAPPPRLARSVLYALTLLVVSTIVWAAWAEVDRVVSASGQLVTTAPTVVVQPLETAIIRAVEVEAGDRVTAGQRLATLDPTFAAADLADLTARLAAADAQVTRLQAEHDGRDFAPGDDPDRLVQAGILLRRQAEYAARLSSFDQQASQLEATQATSRASREGLVRRLGVIHEIENIRSELHRKQTGSLLQLLEARNERLRLSDEMESLANRERETGFQLQKVAADRAAFIDEWRRKTAEELVEKTRERATLVEQRAKAARRAALVSLTAPVDAVVLEVAQRSVGSVIKEAEPLFTLVPADVALEVEASIPGADVGRVRVGDPVRVKLDAFPYQRFGVIDGVLRTVSADAFRPDAGRGDAARSEAARAGAAAGGRGAANDAVFRARIRLLGPAPPGAPGGTRLSPGMAAAAEIIVGRRSVLSYFLYPVIRALDESIREP